nr:hypothetical protein [Tanacetum cinerariifolium]
MITEHINQQNQRKFYSKPTNNNLRTSSSSQSANKKQEFVKTGDKKEDKKADEKKRDMSRVKCYNCKKEGHFAKDCKKPKVKDYEYYKTKMLLAKKDKDEQVLLAEDQAWMESSSDSDQEINAIMVFMAQIEKVISDSEASSSSADEKISEQNQGDVNDAIGSKKKTFVVTFDPLALITEKTNVSRSKEKVVVSLDSEGSEADDFSELKKITALLAKAFNRRKFYSKPTNTNLRTLSSSQSVNKKQEFVKTDNKRVEKKDNEKKRDMSREKYAKLEAERYEYMIRNSAYFDNDKQHRKQIADQQVLYDKMSIQLVELDKHKQYAKMMRQNKNLMDINIDALYNILKQNQGYVNDAMGSKKKTIVATFDALALIAEKTNVSRSKEKVVVFSDSEGSEANDFSELKKITALLAKAFNRRKFYSKPTNNNLRTSYSSYSANKKQEFVKTDNKRVEKKDDEKKRDMSRVKCYNCKKEGHFAKDCKKAKVKDYEYYKTKMLLAKKDKDEQALLAEDQAWMESSSDSD